MVVSYYFAAVLSVVSLHLGVEKTHVLAVHPEMSLRDRFAQYGHIDDPDRRPPRAMGVADTDSARARLASMSPEVRDRHRWRH